MITMVLPIRYLLSSSLLLVLFCLFIAYSSHASEVPQRAVNSIQPDLVNPGYHEKPAWFKESFLDLREDVQEATENKKRVLIYFYQDGCPYCAKLLQDNFGQKRLANKTHKNFDVIAINMWGDKEVIDLDGSLTTEKQYAVKMKVMYTPTLVFLTEKGKTALRVNGYYAPNKFETALDFVSGKNERKISFRNYSKKFLKAPTSGKLHSQPFILKPPYNIKKLLKSKKPLLVLFEQKKCHDCDELHNDIFKRDETLEQIKRFNVVRLDMWSKEELVDAQGKTISAKTFAKNLDITNSPSFIFFNKDGKDIFRIDAYMKSFHTQSVLDYIASGDYRKQSNFQRYIGKRAERLEAEGQHIDLMK